MDLIHTFLNIVAPPFTFFSLCLFLPPYWAFKFSLSTLATIFSENVAGKVILVTGASSGIGEELAYEYGNGRRGARLALCARRENSPREVADNARHCGSPDVIVMRADVSKVDNCRRIIDETVNHFGRLDYLVNNAAISLATLFEEASDVANLRPIMVSATPVFPASECAKTLVNSVLRGDRYLTVPSWFRMTYVVKVLCPELMEWVLKVLYLTSPSTPAREAYSKKILDATGAKKLFYPSSIQSSEVKTD